MCLFALWMAVVAGRSTGTNRFPLLNGVLLGLAARAQGLALLAAPVVLMSRRWQPSGACWVFALALLLTVLPYAVRNWRWAGHPFSPWKAYAFLLDTRPFPGDSIYRHAFEQPPSPFRLAIENARWIAAKAKENLKRLRQIISSWGWVLVVGTILNALLWRRWATGQGRKPSTPQKAAIAGSSAPQGRQAGTILAPSPLIPIGSR